MNVFPVGASDGKLDSQNRIRTHGSAGDARVPGRSACGGSVYRAEKGNDTAEYETHRSDRWATPNDKRTFALRVERNLLFASNQFGNGVDDDTHRDFVLEALPNTGSEQEASQ
jgi:hypothetical protein